MVVNEFIKSIARTLGRIAAYVLLGILAYFIFTWFDKDLVKAETIDGSNYRIESITTSYGVGGTYYGTNATDNGYIMGWQWYPLDGNNYQAITASEYYINIQFKFMLTTGTVGNYIPTNFVIQLGSSNTTAICDGYSSFELINSASMLNTSAYTYSYVCDNLVVNQDFDRIRIRANWDSVTPGVYVKSISIDEVSFIDSNDLNPDTGALIVNNDKNTEKIINNNNTNTTTINNYQQQTTNAVNDLNDTMQSESPASNIFVQGVQNIIPSGPATELLQLPFTMVNAIYSGFNSTCSPWNIDTGPLLGNHVWEIPCINLARRLSNPSWSYQGYTLWQLLDIMGFIFMVYEIIMLMINGYNMIAELNDPWEVLYVPKHGGFNTRSGRNYTEF